MSSTVLTFMDFFWIWFIVAVLNGGTTYVSNATAADKSDVETLKAEIAALAEEVRRLRGAGQVG